MFLDTLISVLTFIPNSLYFLVNLVDKDNSTINKEDISTRQIPKIHSNRHAKPNFNHS